MCVCERDKSEDNIFIIIYILNEKYPIVFDDILTKI